MRNDKKKDLDKFVADVQNQILEEERAAFSRKVIEEANNPRNVGRMNNADTMGMIQGSCGDTMEIYLKIDNGRITYATFMTDGCGPTIACGSMLTSLVKGVSIEEALDISKNDLLRELDGLPEEHVHCAELAVTTLKKAILDYLEDEGEL